MERVEDILYKIHKANYYFSVGAFTTYGSSALLFGICLCLIFVTGAYIESPLLLFMGFFGPFAEAKAIVAVHDEGRRLVKQRRFRERHQIYFRKNYIAG